MHVYLFAIGVVLPSWIVPVGFFKCIIGLWNSLPHDVMAYNMFLNIDKCVYKDTSSNVFRHS